MNLSLNTKRILIFLAVAFGIPWIAALVISQTGLMGSDPVVNVSLANLFFISTPWLANIIARQVTGEGGKNLMLRPNFRRGWRFYLAVWLLPLPAVIVGAAVFYLVFPQSFDPNLGEVQKLLANTPSAGLDPWLVLLSMTLSMMLISALLNGVASFGEEFGWRAYLFPKLMESFAGDGRSSTRQDPGNTSGLNSTAARKAAVLVGLIHGVWHWPLLIMSIGLAPGVTFLTPLVYLVLTVTMSILLCWATLHTRSVWPASLGHGALNTTSALPGFLLKGAPIALLGPDPTGLIGGIGYIILALVLFLNRKAFAGRPELDSEKVGAIVRA